MAPPNTPYYTRDVAFSKMKKENFAFHSEPLKVYPQLEEIFNEKDKCDLTEVVIFPPEYCYIALPWGSPYKEAIAIAMRKAIQGGVVHYLDMLWEVPKPACAIKEEFISVDMDKISPAFLIVGMGVVLAVIVLVCEKIMKWRENIREKSAENRSEESAFEQEGNELNRIRDGDSVGSRAVTRQMWLN
ncbi:ionotropic receptor 75a-like [Periplaneta americana]|uniref:ionotropic receptor 75a-like n=1 Tax=Periplaneta americana TaxID=6978 RepID=UPI0037E78AB3